MNISVNMFHEFHIKIDNRQIFLPKKESELLALLVASGGGKITAKNYWEIVVKPLRYTYNARYFASTSAQLRQLLSKYDADIIETGMNPVRFCRINPCAIDCDYYEMLDGTTALIKRDLFLQSYPWASDFYFRSWDELNDFLSTSPLFVG